MQTTLRELTDVKGHVRYDHVSFHYNDDETPVLSDISIDIPAGKSIALVGPSGKRKNHDLLSPAQIL